MFSSSEGFIRYSSSVDLLLSPWSSRMRKLKTKLYSKTNMKTQSRVSLQRILTCDQRKLRSRLLGDFCGLLSKVSMKSYPHMFTQFGICVLCVKYYSFLGLLHRPTWLQLTRRKCSGCVQERAENGHGWNSPGQRKFSTTDIQYMARFKHRILGLMQLGNLKMTDKPSMFSYNKSKRKQF